MTLRDPYLTCEKVCPHELVRGVSVEDLLREDGPHPTDHQWVTYANELALLLGSAAEEVYVEEET